MGGGEETADYEAALFRVYVFRVYTSDGKEAKLRLTERERDKLAYAITNRSTYYGIDSSGLRFSTEGDKIYHVEMLRGWVNGPVKQCSSCLETKPLGEFSRHKSTKDKRTGRCLPCTRAADRRHYEENREAKLECNRRYREENPHRFTEYAQRRRARKLGNGVEPYRRIDIFERDNWICQLCGKPIDPDANYWNDDGTVNTQYRSIDHIIPLAKGGPDAPGNVQAAHLGCNISKGDRTENDNGNSHA